MADLCTRCAGTGDEPEKVPEPDHPWDGDRMVLTLKEPVTHGRETITELRFRRPKAKDLRYLGKIRGGEVDVALEAIAKLSGSTNHAVDELGMDDLEAASEIVGFFLPSGRLAGSGR